MTEIQVIGLLAALLTLCGGVVGIWIRIENRIKQAEKEAAIKTEAAVVHAQLLASQLGEYKLHVSESYVTKSGLRETTEQIMSAIGDIKSSVNGLTTRLDRIIEGQK